jgi:hypothetical protein
MTSSSFVNVSERMPRMANGHMHPVMPLLVVLIPSALLLGAMAVIGLPIKRLLTGKWRPSRRLTVGACLVAVALALLFFALTSLNELRNFLLLVELCAAAFVVLLALLLLLGGRILRRRPAAMQGRWGRALFGTAWVALSIVALVAAAAKVTVPVPRGPSPPASAVGSLRTTAGDLAALLIELVEPRHLSQGMAAEMATPQIAAGEGFSWGVGIGIQHSAQGDSLWQNALTSASGA